MSKIAWDFTEVKVAQERCKDALDQLDSANLDTPATGSVHQPLLEKKINKITKATTKMVKILRLMYMGIEGADKAFRTVDNQNAADLIAAGFYHKTTRKK
ncbi:hypothetical protein [uncultured Actinomyces sp.]|uniref:hypothetical protein n=1 Tax=uncultured Actinomyces sp. TaxID=249061 RepID=UPI0025E55D52|nr:hypothetical protein [uncultured Actinomyces sp.]